MKPITFETKNGVTPLDTDVVFLKVNNVEQTRGYKIEQYSKGYYFRHKDWEGVTFTGEDIEWIDPRYGYGATLEIVYEEIDSIEFELNEKDPVKSKCEVKTVYIDDELDAVTCFYRFIHECPNGQTDVPERLLKIEVAEFNGDVVKLTDWQMQTAAETILNKHS